MYTSMEVEYDSDEDLQDVGNELTNWLSQLDASNGQVCRCEGVFAQYTGGE